MSELGGAEILGPGEGGGQAPEQLSEEAKQRFAAVAAAMKAIQREEKRSKKRDSRVAKTIVQFLNDDRYTHLFVLISRLVARDCPSIFILAILSLVNDECKTVVDEYLTHMEVKSPSEELSTGLSITAQGSLGDEANRRMVEWITRMQMVLSLEARQILQRLMLDEHNIDGTVLQLTTFVLQDFFGSDSGGRRNIPFEKLHILTASILQSVFEPFLDKYEKRAIEAPRQGKDAEDEEDDDD